MVSELIDTDIAQIALEQLFLSYKGFSCSILGSNPQGAGAHNRL